MSALDLLAKRRREVDAVGGGDVQSPCVSVCRMDPVTELCEGCLRTLDEIALWSRLDDAGKRDVWQVIGDRLQRLHQQLPSEERGP